MEKKIEIHILVQDKNTLKEIKRKKKFSFAFQLEMIFSKYAQLPVEDLVIIVEKTYPEILKCHKHSQITTGIRKFEESFQYFRKIHLALITKIPRLEFNDLTSIIVYHHLRSKNISLTDKEQADIR
jgi:hypothetical protein